MCLLHCVAVQVRELRAQVECLMSQLQVQQARMESAHAAADLAVEQVSCPVHHACHLVMLRGK